MGEIVNLRRARRRRAKEEQAKTAAEARAVHGRSQHERRVQTRAAERASETLDGARLELGPRPDPDD